MFLFKTMLPIPSSIKAKNFKTFWCKDWCRSCYKTKCFYQISLVFRDWGLFLIGEDVWIDNLAFISIGKTCFISRAFY